MAFEPVYEEVKLNSRRRLCQTQAVVEARLLPKPNIVIARVLSIACDSVINASEVFTGEARYNGRVNFKVLFVDVDGNNHSMDYSADFSDKVNDDKIISGLKSYFSSEVLDTEIVNVTTNEIKLATVVEIYLDAEVVEDLKYMLSGGDGIYTHSEKIDYCRLVYSGGNEFSVTADLKDVKLSKMLMTESRGVILDRSAGVDSVKISGVIITDVCGETLDGLLAGYQISTEFSEELPALDARPDNIVTAGIKVSADTVFEGDDESSNLSITYLVKADYSVYGEDSVDAVIDAFSVTHEILTNIESVDIYKNKSNKTVTDRVEGSVTLEINMPIVDNILAATGLKLNITNIIAGDDDAVIEGIVSGNIIYYSAEENSKNSVAVELPFSLKARVDGIIPDDVITAKGAVTSATVKIRRGNEIDIRSEIAVELCCCAKNACCVIAEISAGEEREVPTSAISIHIAKSKETLWDIAKALGTTPELVLLQNPNLTLPLSGGERIIAYRHLEK